MGQADPSPEARDDTKEDALLNVDLRWVPRPTGYLEGGELAGLKMPCSKVFSLAATQMSSLMSQGFSLQVFVMPQVLVYAFGSTMVRASCKVSWTTRP